MGSCCRPPHAPSEKPVAPPSCCTGGEAEKNADDTFWTRFAASVVATGIIMALGLGVSSANESGEPLLPGSEAYRGVHGAMIVSALTPVLLLGRPLFRDTMRAWAAKKITVDSLFVASAAGAFVTSLISTVRGDAGQVYYDTVPLVMVIWALGRRVGEYSRERAFAAVAALRAEFDFAQVRLADGSVARRRVAELSPEDRVLVAPGGAIPVDGEIVSGVAYIVEAAMTGEALPVARGPGCAVSAGTWSRDGALVIRPNPGVRRLDAIFAAVESAKATPSRYQERADRIVAWFFPFVMLAAGATFAGWWIAGDLAGGIRHAMAVLLVACPCALGLATPVAIWSGLHKLARLGLVSRYADLIGTLATANRIVFDKTGTLSGAELRVDHFVVAPEFSGKSAELSGLLSAVQSRVDHPVAKAFAASGSGSGFSGFFASITQVVVEPGAGVRAEIADETGLNELHAGEPALVGESTARELDSLAPEAGGKRVYVTFAGRPAALAILRESFRDEADPAFRSLEKLGLKITVLTGDASARGSGVLNAETEAGLSPDEKAARVEEWKRAGETVVFVGDGLNDASAIACADASIAMGAGVDLAKAAAQGVLTRDRLDALPPAITLCRRIDGTLRENILWAAAYNTVGITLAASGRLNPVYAAIIMLVSSLFVTWRAARAAGMIES